MSARETHPPRGPARPRPPDQGGASKTISSRDQETKKDGRRPTVEPRARRPALRPVPLPQPTGRRFPFFIAAFLVVGGLVVAVVSTQALVSQGSFRVQDLTRRTTALQEEYGQLKLEVAQLSSPGRIAEEARLLGFSLPDYVRILHVPGGSSSSPHASPTGGLPSSPRPDVQPSFALKGLLEGQP